MYRHRVWLSLGLLWIAAACETHPPRPVRVRPGNSTVRSLPAQLTPTLVAQRLPSGALLYGRLNIRSVQRLFTSPPSLIKAGRFDDRPEFLRLKSTTPRQGDALLSACGPAQRGTPAAPIPVAACGADT